MGVHITLLCRASARMLVIMGVAAGMVLVPSAANHVPTAQASVLASTSPCSPCFHQRIKDSIKSKGDDNVDYDVMFSWHASNGIVDGFIVDYAYAIPNQYATNAKVDIQPYRPLEWGPTYLIYINVTADSTLESGTLGYNGSSVTGKSRGYQAYHHITLNADGTFTDEGETG
jgi:hypothetical protein